MHVQVADNFVPPLLETVLLDYQHNVPAAREPEVLSSLAVIVERLKVHSLVCYTFTYTYLCNQSQHLQFIS